MEDSCMDYTCKQLLRTPKTIYNWCNIQYCIYGTYYFVKVDKGNLYSYLFMRLPIETTSSNWTNFSGSAHGSSESPNISISFLVFFFFFLSFFFFLECLTGRCPSSSVCLDFFFFFFFVPNKDDSKSSSTRYKIWRNGNW